MSGVPGQLLRSGFPGVRPGLILLGACLGLLVGGGLHLTQPALYQSSTVLELAEIAPLVDIAPRGGTVDRLAIDTDAQLVQSDLVVAPVAAAVGHRPAQVREALTVSARPLSRVLEVQFTDADAETARRGAEAAARAFLDARERLVVQPVRDYLQALQTSAQAPLSTGEVARGDRFSEAARLEELRQRAVVAELELTAPGRVSQAARVPDRPERPDPEVPLASAAASGALLALAGQLAARRPGHSRSPAAHMPFTPSARPRSLV